MKSQGASGHAISSSMEIFAFSRRLDISFPLSNTRVLDDDRFALATPKSDRQMSDLSSFGLKNSWLPILSVLDGA